VTFGCGHLQQAAGRPAVLGVAVDVLEEAFVGGGRIGEPLPLPVGEEVSPNLSISPIRARERINLGRARHRRRRSLLRYLGGYWCIGGTWFRGFCCLLPGGSWFRGVASFRAERGFGVERVANTLAWLLVAGKVAGITEAPNRRTHGTIREPGLVSQLLHRWPAHARIVRPIRKREQHQLIGRGDGQIPCFGHHAYTHASADPSTVTSAPVMV